MAEKSIQDEMLPLSHLKPLLGLAEKDELGCALGLSPDRKELVFLVDKRVPARKLADQLRARGSGVDVASVRFGLVTFAPGDLGTVKVQLNKAAPGGTIPLFVKLMKKAGYQGASLDVADMEAEASAMGEASAGAAPGVTPAPPAPPPPLAGPTADARLKTLALRIGPVVAADPSQKEKLVGMVREAQTALAAGKPIDALLDQLGALLAVAAGSAPGGMAEAPKATDGPTVALAKSSQLWRGCRTQMRGKLEKLKAAILEAYGDVPDVQRAIRQNFGELDKIFERLDDRLGDTLDQAMSTAAGAGRSALLERTREIVGDYTKTMESDELLAQLDANPFGVEMKFKETLGKVLPALAGLARTVH